MDLIQSKKAAILKEFGFSSLIISKAIFCNSTLPHVLLKCAQLNAHEKAHSYYGVQKKKNL